MPPRLRLLVERLTQHRSTRLTSEGIQFLLVTLAVGVAAINTGNNLFYLLLAMMLSLILMSGIVAEHCLRKLEFHRHLPDLLFAQEPATATIVIKNGKPRWPSFSLRLYDVIEGRDLDRGLTVRQLLPGTSQILSYPILATRRGRLQLDGIRVITSFPFGLFVKKAHYPVSGTVAVCPHIMTLDDALVQDLVAAGHEHPMARRGYGNDLYNLRLYHSGDDSRNIHWVTTAKTSKLIVRETEAEDQRRATIHLPTDAPADQDALFEDAVTFTASLVTHLTDRGYHLRLVIGPIRSSFGLGAAHLSTLLHMLAVCERRTPDSVDHVFQDAAEPEDFNEGCHILVQPWAGNDRRKVGSSASVIDAATVTGASHVV